MSHQIPFNKPHLTGNETRYIQQALLGGKMAGNGPYTQRCQTWLGQRYGFAKCLLTHSCTAALEMAAILIGIQPGDEVIMPSYTFVSTANAFVLRGARIVFADSRADHPGMDERAIEALITPKTKAIVPVHYAGVACDMDAIMALARKHGLFVVEDAAHAIDAFYTGADGVKRPLGSLGHLAAFSFHETKNITSGEGGMLVINDERFMPRAEVVWEKGTNRSSFFRGEVDEYGWMDIGSSFLPSEPVAAFLWAQLEALDRIQQKRITLWDTYRQGLAEWAGNRGIQLPSVPAFATGNAHLFYLVCRHTEQRNRLMRHLRQKGVPSAFHYLALHGSPYYSPRHDGRTLPHADRYTEALLRLPLFYGLGGEDMQHVLDAVRSAQDLD